MELARARLQKNGSPLRFLGAWPRHVRWLAEAWLRDENNQDPFEQLACLGVSQLTKHALCLERFTSQKNVSSIYGLCFFELSSMALKRVFISSMAFRPFQHLTVLSRGAKDHNTPGMKFLFTKFGLFFV